jgi:hypothetical protein
VNVRPTPAIQVHRHRCIASTISKVQLLSMFSFHSLVATTPDTAITKTRREQQPSRRQRKPSLRSSHDPIAYGNDIRELDWVVDSLAFRPLPA